MTTTTTTIRRPEAFDLFSLEAVPEDLREQVAALIPSPAIAEGYVHRELDGLSDFDAFAIAVDEGFNVLLEGPTGAAKSLAARAFASAHQVPFYAVAVNGGIDPAALWGRWLLVDGETVWQWSPAALVALYGGILLFDELNMTHPRIGAALHDLLSLARRVAVMEKGGEVLKAHPACFFIGTMNPGYQGVSELNQALRRRFGWAFDWQYSNAVEEVLIPCETLREFASTVRELPEVRSDLSTDTLVTFIDTVAVAGLRFAAGRLIGSFRDAERGGISRAFEQLAPSIASELGVANDFSL